MENIRFHITVKGIVVYHQKVLLMKRIRPSTDGLGYWELPGGGLEFGEGLIECLHREFDEELNVKITWGGDWTSFRDGPHFQIELN